MAAPTRTRTALVTSATNTATSTTRGRLDMTSYDGGYLTMRITNGATGPTIACVGRVLVGHKDSAMPSAAGEGTADGDWKQVWEFGGLTANSATARGQWVIPPGVAYVEVEFTGNTAQSVTVEAIATTFVY